MTSDAMTSDAMTATLDLAGDRPPLAVPGGAEAAPAGTRSSAARRWLAASRGPGRRFFLAAGVGDLIAALGTILACWNMAALIVAAVDGRRPSDLTGAVGGVLIGGVVAAFALFAANRLATAGAARVESALRSDLIDALVLADPAGSSPSTGAAAAAVAEQLPHLGEYFRGYARAAFAAGAVPIAIEVAVFPASWVVGLLLLFSMPIVPLNMAVTGLGAAELSRRQMTQISELSSQVLERLQATSSLRALGAIGHQRRVVERAANELARRTAKVLRVAFLASTALEWVSTFAIGVVAMYTGATLLGYVHAPLLPTHIGAQQAVFVLLLAPEFFLPLRRFAAAYHQGQEAIAAAEVLQPLTEALSEDSSQTRVAASTAAGSVWTGPPPEVRLDGVTVRFAGRSWPALRAVDLRIAPGRVFGVAGPSGAGKSTLLRVAGGWQRPTEGSALLDGRPSADGPRALQIGQRPYLFAGTVALKLALGQPELSPERMWEAIESAPLSEVLRRLPDGLDTMLGERGWGLSGGEAQRLAIARAFLSSATLLIVDEPTAHLDGDTEQSLLEPLRRLLSGRTALIASHSDRVLAISDYVVELEEGTVHA
ncbi:MAG: thiol reductant exporter, ATP-binding protein CydD [Frankiales bacterium]|nr:thiol reductant exporter, ATP-binding protein CydD [Frankiales bacterium]